MPIRLRLALIVLAGAVAASACSGSSTGAAGASAAPTSAPASATGPPSGPATSSTPPPSAAVTTAAAATSKAATGALVVAATVVHDKGSVTVFVPVTIHAKNYDFVLDSGAITTILDSSVARSLRLKTIGSGPPIKTIGCTQPTTLSQIDDWSLGGKRLPTSKLVTQRTGLARMRVHGVPVAGVLGSDEQNAARVVSIDYRAQKVTFGAGAPSGGQSVRIQVVRSTNGGAVLAAPVTVGSRHLVMQIDTGASRTTLSQALVAELNLPKAGPVAKGNALGCQISAQPVWLAGAKLGSVTLPKTVIVATAQSSVASKIDGLLGSDLLASFGTITIDYAGARVVLGA